MALHQRHFHKHLRHFMSGTEDQTQVISWDLCQMHGSGLVFVFAHRDPQTFSGT